MPEPSPVGSTFAERAAAARGDKDWKPEDVPAPHNSTFAERAGGEPAKGDDQSSNSTFAARAAARKKASGATKAVDAEGDGAENKAVAKKPASKKS